MLQEAQTPAWKFRTLFNKWWDRLGFEFDKEPIGTDFAIMGPRRIHIEHIEVFDKANRRKGLGTMVMRKYCEIADQLGVVLTLEPAALDEETPHLSQWYSRFGFDWNNEGMIRQPNS